MQHSTKLWPPPANVANAASEPSDVDVVAIELYLGRTMQGNVNDSYVKLT